MIFILRLRSLSATLVRCNLSARARGRIAVFGSMTPLASCLAVLLQLLLP